MMVATNYCAFATFDEASEFAKKTRGAGHRTDAHQAELRTSLLTLLALITVAGGACSRAGIATAAEAAARPGGRDGGHGSASRMAGTDAGAPDGAALPVVEEGDCPSICEKLLRCGQGPWRNPVDCQDACEASNEDAISGKTYRCVAKAKTCSRMKKCTR